MSPTKCLFCLGGCSPRHSRLANRMMRVAVGKLPQNQHVVVRQIRMYLEEKVLQLAILARPNPTSPEAVILILGMTKWSPVHVSIILSFFTSQQLLGLMCYNFLLIFVSIGFHYGLFLPNVCFCCKYF